VAVTEVMAAALLADDGGDSDGGDEGGGDGDDNGRGDGSEETSADAMMAVAAAS